MGGEDLGGGFALGFGVGWGLWFVFEGVGEAGGCQGAGFGFEDGLSCVGDFFEGVDGLFESV